MTHCPYWVILELSSTHRSFLTAETLLLRLDVVLIKKQSYFFAAVVSTSHNCYCMLHKIWRMVLHPFHWFERVAAKTAQVIR